MSELSKSEGQASAPHKIRRVVGIKPALTGLAAIPVLTAASLLMIFHFSALNQYLELKIEIPAVNFLRNVLQIEQSLNPRLKFVRIDDRTRAALGGRNLVAKDYTKIIQGVLDERPSKVLVAIPFHSVSAMEPGFEELDQVLAQPAVVTGVDRYPVGVSLIDKIVRGRDDLQIFSQWQSDRSYSWLPEEHEAITPRPPHEDFNRQLMQIGHMEILPGGRVPIAIGESQNLSLALGLYTAFDIRLDASKIYVNGKSVPIRKGALVINWVDRQELKSQTVNASDYLDSSAAPRSNMDGRIVVVFDGDDDALRSIASVANSTLERIWIKQFYYPIPVTLGMVALIFLVFYWTKSSARFFLLAGAVASLFLGGMFCSAVLLKYHLPWGFPLAVVFIVGMALLVLRLYRELQRRAETNLTWQGMIPGKALARIHRQPEIIREPAGEVSATVMFVDVDSFSTVCEQLTPEEVFNILRTGFRDMAQCVLDHSGTVERFIGQGFLAVFGPGIPADQYDYDHADRAVQCAKQLQHQIARRCIHAKGEPIFTIRIGINSGSAFWGDIGFARRDFTLVGHTVSFAKRFEEACQPFMVVLGPGTKAMLAKFTDTDTRFVRCQIGLNERRALLDVFEFNPFHDNQALLVEARKAYRDYTHVHRIEDRIDIPYQMDLPVMINQKVQASLANFSRNGISVVMNKVYVSHVMLRIEFMGPLLKNRLSEIGITTLLCEVRWHRSTADSHLHGLQIKNLSEDQKKRLFEQLESAIENGIREFKQVS